MAEEPGHAQCNCADACIGYAHCSLAWIYASGQCVGSCTDPERVVKRHNQNAVFDKLGLGGLINLDLHGASLGEAAALIAEITNAQIYVPADRIDERRTLYLEGVSVETVVRELELIALVGR